MSRRQICRRGSQQIDTIPTRRPADYQRRERWSNLRSASDRVPAKFDRVEEQKPSGGDHLRPLFAANVGLILTISIDLRSPQDSRSVCHPQSPRRIFSENSFFLGGCY